MDRTENLERSAMKTTRESCRVIEDLTVIIPTVGRPILQRCLEAISAGSVLPARIIVVDQGDNSLVADWIQNLRNSGLEIHHLRSMERSPASARNQGLRQVQTSFVAAVDDDCLPERDWLEKMHIKLQNNPEAIITGRVEPAGDGVPPSVVTSDIPRLMRHPSVRIPNPLPVGNMGCAMSTARRIGPFDEKFFTAEDIDWAYRALRAGIPILYAPEIVVNHFHWRSESEVNTTWREYSWGLGLFYGKYLRRGDLSMLVRTAISLFRGVKDLFFGVIKNDNNRRVNGYARMTYLLPGLLAGLRGFRSL
jgi:GT2 family glycosyltransferase